MSLATIHSLPALKKRPNKIISPIIDKMQSLHSINIQVIRKQQKQNQNILQTYFKTKNQYFLTTHPKKEETHQKVLKNFKNKSSLLLKQNSNKFKNHQQAYKNFVSFSKEKIVANYMKEKAKIELARIRKYELNQSRVKQPNLKQTKPREHYLEMLNKSQQLQKTTVQRLLQAQNRRLQLRRQKQNSIKGKLDLSIHQAQVSMKSSLHERQRKYIEKSIKKVQQSQAVVDEYRQRKRISSESSKKSSLEKLMRAQSTKNQRQKQMYDNLEKIFEQKGKKTQTVNERKIKNLAMLSNTLRSLRSQYMEEVQKKNQSFYVQNEKRNEKILEQSNEKWKFLTGLKSHFDKIKNKNIYETQQISLRF